jgi:hypothetical protein
MVSFGKVNLQKHQRMLEISGSGWLREQHVVKSLFALFQILVWRDKKSD